MGSYRNWYIGILCTKFDKNGEVIQHTKDLFPTSPTLLATHLSGILVEKVAVVRPRKTASTGDRYNVLNAMSKR